MSPINNDELNRIFKKLDKNNDGQVSINELKWLLDGIGIHTGLSELETLVGKETLDLVDFGIFYDILLNGRRKEECHEFVEEVENKDLIETFRVFDMNGDGFISSEEVEKMLSKLGLWDGDCRSMIESYDSNRDGLIDFDEFKRMMKF